MKSSCVALLVLMIASPAVFAVDSPRADLARGLKAATAVRGGLAVVLGCGDTALLKELAASGFVVQALDTDTKQVATARQVLQADGSYGKVSAAAFDGTNLPYVDNLVNLLVMRDARFEVQSEEVERVLAPRGVLATDRKSEISNRRSNRVGDWFIYGKPVPDTIDDWPMHMYEPGNNAVSRDRLVGPPKHLQWRSGPVWTRSHEFASSLNAMVSMNGKLFYVKDEGSRLDPILPEKWTLVCRDAFNGIVLWRRVLPSWHTHWWPVKSGPTQVMRRLVALDDKLYIPLGAGAPLSTDHVTIAEMLKQAGYATGIIGKWHLTGYRHHGAELELRPTDHGFDQELVCEIKGVGNEPLNFFPYVFRTQPISWLNVQQKRLPGNEYLVDRMNYEGVEFIERNRDRPFLLSSSHYAVHTILNGKPELVEKYRRKHPPGESTRDRCYLCEDAGLEGDTGNHWAQDHNPHLAAMLESINHGVGMILETLERLELDDNTIVIFTSDNGGETNVTSNAPLRGGKSSLYEGGIRVPLIVRWPKVIQANTVCDEPTSNVDFYPTLLECANVQPDPRQQLDGVSILPILKNPQAKLHRDALYWHYPLEKPHFLGGRSAGAIRQGDWKLIEFFDTKTIELYNLARDAGEQHNLANSHPDKTAELTQRLADWRRIIATE